jgi:hypothetical protein
LCIKCWDGAQGPLFNHRFEEPDRRYATLEAADLIGGHGSAGRPRTPPARPADYGPDFALTGLGVGFV